MPGLRQRRGRTCSSPRGHKDSVSASACYEGRGAAGTLRSRWCMIGRRAAAIRFRKPVWNAWALGAGAGGAGDPVRLGTGSQVTATLFGQGRGNGRVHGHGLLLSVGLPGGWPVMAIADEFTISGRERVHHTESPTERPTEIRVPGSVSTGRGPGRGSWRAAPPRGGGIKWSPAGSAGLRLGGRHRCWRMANVAGAAYCLCRSFPPDVG